MGMLARLGVVLGLDAGEFKSGIDAADRSLTKFTAKLPQMGAVAAAAFTAATYKALQYADAVADAAKASDVAISSVIALSKGLQQNGGNADDAGKMLATFSAKIDEAAQGSLEGQKAFARIGVTLKDLAQMGTEELFDKTVKAIAALEDPAARAALATTMFGKAAKGVDFVGLAEGSDEAKIKFQEYAAAVEQAAELNDRLEAASSAMSLSFTNAVIPTLMKVYDALSEDTRGMEMLMEAVKFGTKFIADAFHTVYTVVMSVVEATIFLKNAMVAIFSDSTISEEYEKYNQRIADLIKKNIEFRNLVWDDTKSAPKGAPTFGGREVTKAKNPEDEKLKKQLEALEMAKKLSVEYARQADFDLAQLKRKAELVGLTEKQRQVAEAEMSMRESIEQKLQAIESKRQDAIIKNETALAEELQRQKDNIASLGDYYISATQKQILATQEAQSTFEFGWNKAFNQYLEDSENAANRGAGYFQTMTSAMNAAIDTFVQTGKFSFKDFTSSIIRNLIAMEMKMQAMQLFRMGIMAMGFGRAPVSTGTATGYDMMQAYADGGDPPVGVPSLVGERGPELFIPKTAGTIIPNNRLSSSMGGAPQVVYNGPYIANMSAIDTQSATQFLIKNKQTVWAANQSAQRALPVSR
jgi:lambda family phage tail tape measure protein